jgi:hypothetical protein
VVLEGNDRIVMGGFKVVPATYVGFQRERKTQRKKKG